MSYCVKCSRISPISVFYISQGTAATHLRCGGQCVMILLQISCGEYNRGRILKIGQHLSQL